jgi:hypothetical protein
LAKRKKHSRGNIRDFQCLLKVFPVSNIWKHWLLLKKQNFLPGRQKYFLPNSETFDETLFPRLPTLVMTYRNIGKTNINMKNIFAQQCFPVCPGL